MKIAIYTLPLHANYGGILQCWALQTILERMGHSVDVIDRDRYLHVNKYRIPFRIVKRTLKKIFFGSHQAFFPEWKHNHTLDVTEKYTKQFITAHIHSIYLRDRNKEFPQHYDAILVGSDQIWRPKELLYHGTVENGFLDFAKNWNIKRIAYAASFGTDKWEYTDEQTRNCRQLVKLFDAVSVREKNGIALCLEHLGIQASQLIDPTMLLSYDDYCGLLKKLNLPKSNGNLLCYILDETEEKQKLIEKVAVANSLKPFKANSKYEDWDSPINERIQPSVESWLKAFYDAEFVITDSFHACVFSIIFRKPFIAYGNITRGVARFQSLLSMFHLEDRLVFSSAECDNLFHCEIDWEEIHDILKKQQEISCNYLKTYLS